MHKLSVQTADWLNVLFDEMNPEEGFRFIKDCGFEGVDFNLDHTLPSDLLKAGKRNDYFDAPVEEILERYRPVKEAAEKVGISIVQAHAPFPLYHEDNPELLDYMIMATSKLLKVCQYIGCPNLVVHPHKELDKEHEWLVNEKLYRALMPVAKETGVKICLENLWIKQGDRIVGAVCSDPYEACFYIDTFNEEAGEELFGLCYDVGHANMTARNIFQDLKVLGSRIACLHIHDNDVTVDRHLFPYSCKASDRKNTMLDWEAFYAGLKEIGYKGDLNFETFGQLLVTPTELWKANLRYLNTIGQYIRKRIQ